MLKIANIRKNLFLNFQSTWNKGTSNFNYMFLMAYLMSIFWQLLKNKEYFLILMVAPIL